MDKQIYRKELLKPVKKIFPHRHIQAYYNNDIWSADLIDVQKYAARNDNFKYILLIIDIYSRYIWLFPLLNKESKTVLDCFETFNELPENLWTDRGSEFTNKRFKNWCKANDVNLYHTGGESKAVFAERAIRTIRGLINGEMIEDNTDRYIDDLADILHFYNHHIHSSIKETPSDVYFKGVEPFQNYASTVVKKPKFKVGDYVRISRVKMAFEKGYSANWSEEVFKIIGVDNSENPVMYQLEDLLGEKVEGKFYGEELQKTDLKDYAIVEKVLQEKKGKGKRMFLVKYRGYDNKFNEWISEEQLERLR